MANGPGGGGIEAGVSVKLALFNGPAVFETALKSNAEASYEQRRATAAVSPL